MDGVSLALDAGGSVHIAAFDVTNRDLRYITNMSGSMVATTLDSTGDVGRTPRIALSPVGGSVQIAYVHYASGTANSIKRAVRSSGVWSFEPVYSGELIPYLSFALDNLGNPHVAFLEVVGGADYRVTYGSKSGAAPWAFSVIHGVTGFKQPSIAMDPSGFAHIVFNGRPSVSEPETLLHATNSAGTWVTEVVHPVVAGGGPIGQHNSLAIHPVSGRLHVAYFDAVQGDLRYARKDPGGVWVRRLIDSAGTVGRDTSIAVDGSEVVHISYYDATNQDLKLATGSP
jgi:hypothetical protein